MPAPTNDDMRMNTIQWTLRNEVRPKSRIPVGQRMAPNLPTTRRASGGPTRLCFCTVARYRVGGSPVPGKGSLG
jgi:hypothetical protein